MKIAEKEIHIWFTYHEKINPDFSLTNYGHIVLVRPHSFKTPT